MMHIALLAVLGFCGSAYPADSPESQKAESDAPFEAVAQREGKGVALPAAAAKKPTVAPAPQANANLAAPQPPTPKYWEERWRASGGGWGFLVSIVGSQLAYWTFVILNSLDHIIRDPFLLVPIIGLGVMILACGGMGVAAGESIGGSLGRERDREERAAYKKALRAYKKQEAAKKKEELKRKLAAPAVPVDEESVDDSAEDRFKLQ